MPQMTTEKINPLSKPKGAQFSCEMCGKVATIMCATCRVTHYCTREHQVVDWNGIHDKICVFLPSLRKPEEKIGSEEERIKRAEARRLSQRSLIDLSKTEASKNLVRGQYEIAIPGALQALRFSMDVFGQGKVELVEPYLLIAEANLGLSKFKQAEEYLSLANWVILKTPNCSNALRSQLHRNFGKLYSSQGRYEESLKQLAHDIYFSSLKVGPEHIDTSVGYFHMGNVFYTLNRTESALALFDKVVDIWYKFLTQALTSLDDNDLPTLGEAQAAEAVEMLGRIMTAREQVLGPSHITTGESAYILGMLFQFLGDIAKAVDYVGRAVQLYHTQLGPEHQTTSDVRKYHDQLQELIS